MSELSEIVRLSEAALALFHRRLAGERVQVTADNKPLYRELAAAGLMYPVSGFTHGPEANFRFTEAGWAMRPSDDAVPPA